MANDKALMSTQEHTHGNRIWPHKPLRDEDVPVVRKVDVSTVPSVLSADMVSRNGRTVWAGFDGERVVCVAATADEARKMWRAFMYRQRQAASEKR